MNDDLHCIPLTPGAEPAERRASGDHLDAVLRSFAAGETLTGTEGALFEEVGAVIEGEFHVEAAGESYDLAAGEGIVIPPDEPREWRCDSARGGLLYRVLVRVPGVA